MPNALALLLAAAAVCFPCIAESIHVSLATGALIRTRLESGLVKPRERQLAIRGLFADAGCQAEEQPIDKYSGNVICTLPGETGSTITVGGHFDFVDRGTGIVDNWSGASLLPSLYEALKNLPRRHTYRFVAFAQEERGLVGSTRYVKKLSSDQKAQLRAYVNLDCIGLSPVKIWRRRSTPALVSPLLAVAAALGMKMEGVDVDDVGDDDTHPFLYAKIPVLSLHSITQRTNEILHSPRDRLDAIHFDDYYASYRLVASYLAFLDLKPE